MTNEQLSPCPFCGDADVRLYGEYTSESWIECLECGAKGPDKGSAISAAEAWNKAPRLAHEPTVAKRPCEVTPGCIYYAEHTGKCATSEPAGELASAVSLMRVLVAHSNEPLSSKMLSKASDFLSRYPMHKPMHEPLSTACERVSDLRLEQIKRSFIMALDKGDPNYMVDLEWNEGLSILNELTFKRVSENRPAEPV